MATIKDLKAWLDRDLSRFGKISEHVEITEDQTGDGTAPSDAFAFRIYTDLHIYSINGRNPAPGKTNGYLGCIASSRKARAGETWHRGNDLADGSLSEETWHRVLADIVSYEMVRLAKTPPSRAAGVGGSAPPGDEPTKP